jgi:hypothetical protein
LDRAGARFRGKAELALPLLQFALVPITDVG